MQRKTFHISLLGLMILLPTILAGCGDDGFPQGCFLRPDISGLACTPELEAEFVSVVMDLNYLWNDQLPLLDPADFDSADALLDALVADVVPRDRFSTIADQASESAFIQEGQFIGFGFSLAEADDGSVRFVQVFGHHGSEPDSPASRAGLERGFSLLAVDGVSVADLVAAAPEGTSAVGAVIGALGPGEPGLSSSLTWADREGTEQSATLTKAVVTIAPVPFVRVLPVGGRPTGYVFFRSFIGPAMDALHAAFSRLGEEGVEDVVLDLRYNGGGLVYVAEYLADLLAGVSAGGEVFVSFQHNQNNWLCDGDTVFLAFPESLQGLERLVVITTGATASASEAVMNGLEPHLSVISIGSTTVGKPVGSTGFSFCDKILRPITFQLVNALGEGDYFDGIPADCAASDDLLLPIGDPEESMLKAALAYLGEGTCAQALSAADDRQPGWPANAPVWRQWAGAL